MTFEPKKDPVCGMDVDPKTAAGKSDVVGVWMTWREAKRKGLDEKHFGVPLLVHLLRKNTEAHTALS